MGNKKPTQGRHRASHSSRYGGVGTQLFDVIDLKVGVAAIAFVMGSSHELHRPSVVVSQNSGVKKPPAIFGWLVHTMVA